MWTAGMAAADVVYLDDPGIDRVGLTVPAEEATDAERVDLNAIYQYSTSVRYPRCCVLKVCRRC